MPLTKPDQPFSGPKDDALLWRYVDLPKYVSMLSTRSLWFSRVDLLGDPFEGSLSAVNAKTRAGRFRDQGGTDTVEKLSRLNADLRRMHYVSCWHESEYESAAMWRLYGRDHGIAVVSTYARMTQALRGNRDIHVGQVTYIDYATEEQALGTVSYAALLYKRKSFEHEREVRAVFMADLLTVSRVGERLTDPLAPEPTVPDGHPIPVDAAQLIAEVRVNPEAPKWYFDAVSDLTLRYDVPAPVSRSAMVAGDPLF
jgi:hypothetical protein